MLFLEKFQIILFNFQYLVNTKVILPFRKASF